MKIVTIRPVREPKSFSGVKFTQEEYKAAKKAGEKEVPYPTALEALRQGRGLYEIKPAAVATVELAAPKAPEDMTSSELAMEMTAFGKPPRKTMTREKAVEFINKLRTEAADMIVD